MRLYLMCCFLSFLSLALGNNGDVSICCQACDCLFVNWSKMSALKNNAFHVCGLERLVLEMANSQQSRVPSAGPLGMGAGPWVNYDRYIYTSSSLLNHAVTIAQVEGWGQRLLLLVWSLFVAGLCSSGSTKRNPVTRHKRCLFGPWCLNIRSHLVASQAVAVLFGLAAWHPQELLPKDFYQHSSPGNFLAGDGFNLDLAACSPRGKPQREASKRWFVKHT